MMFTRLWRWLFPKPRIIRPFAHVWPEMTSVLTLYRPDLLAEFNTFGSRSPAALADWLDEHFPLSEGHWGVTSFERAPANLREYLENAK